MAFTPYNQPGGAPVAAGQVRRAQVRARAWARVHERLQARERARERARVRVREQAQLWAHGRLQMLI